MTYKNIVDHFCAMTGRTLTESNQICSTILGIITNALLNGDTVDIYGFGKLYTADVPSRKVIGIDGFNHMTKPKRTVRFRVGKAFERRLTNGAE